MRFRSSILLGFSVLIYFALGVTQAASAQQPLPSPEPEDRGAVATYLRGLRQIRGIYQAGALDPISESPERIAAAAEVFRVGRPDWEQPEIERMIGLIRNYRPLYRGTEDRIWLGSRRGLQYSRNGLEKLHGSELLAGLILDRDRLDEVRSLALLLGLPDPTQSEVAKKLINAGDLFSEVANGDGVLSVQELTYVINYALSAVRTTLEILADSGCSALATQACLFDQLDRGFAQYFRNLPALVSILGGLSREERSAYFGDLLRIAGVSPSDPRISPLELQVFVSVIHLLEGSFLRFDANHDERLSTSEIKSALPIFHPTVGRLSGLLDPWIDAGITYLLKYGIMPGHRGIQLTRFIIWRFTRFAWRLEVGRPRLAHTVVLVMDAARP